MMRKKIYIAICALITIIAVILVGTAVLAAEGNSEFNTLDGKPMTLTESNEDLFDYNEAREYDLVKEEYVSGYKITKYKGNEEKVVIPKSIGGINVIAIGKDCFRDNSNIKEIYFQSGIVDMDEYAVYHCNNLKVVHIGCNALDFFPNKRICNETQIDTLHLGKKVKAINIDDTYRLSVREYVVDNENEMFSSENGMLLSKDGRTLKAYPEQKTDTEFNLQNKLSRVSYNAFLNNKYLENVYISNSKGIKIENSIFNNNNNLKNVIIDGVTGTASVKMIKNCNAVGSVSLTALADSSEENIFEYEGTTLSDNIDKFVAGDGFSKIIIPDRYDIETGYCDNVVVGKDVEEIINNRNENIPLNLEIDKNNPFIKKDGNAIVSRKGKTLFLYLNDKSIEKYSVPDGITEIKTLAFANAKHISVIELPKTMSRLKTEVQDDYSSNTIIGNNISAVTIPSSVTYIEKGCIENSVSIFGEKGSTAEQYAKENGNLFFDVFEDDSAPVVEDNRGISIWDGISSEELTNDNTKNYYINSASQLNWVREQVNSGAESFYGKNLILNVNIDLGGKEWTYIGTTSHPFKGSFNGNKHTISNFTNTSGSYAGLFGVVSYEGYGVRASIKNLTTKKIKYNNAKGAGVIIEADVFDGAVLDISNIKTTAENEGTSRIGGIVQEIVGYKATVNIKNCRSNMDIDSPESVGGIVDTITYKYDKDHESVITIENCRFNGVLNTKNTNRGKAGIVYAIGGAGDGKTIIKHCAASGKITGSYSLRAGPANLGGIISETGRYRTDIIQCVNKMTILGGYYIGGIAGSTGANTLVKECANEKTNKGSITGTVHGGIVGISEGKIEDCLNIADLSMGLYGGGIGLSYTGGVAGWNRGVLTRSYSISKISKATATHCQAGIATHSWNEISHSYFNADFAEPGTDIKDVIVNYEGGFTNDCLPLSSAEMKKESTYKTWDFENIWEFDNDYCYGYPALTGILDLMSKHKGENENNIAKVTVVDDKGKKIKNAIVEYGTGNEKEISETDKKGVAKFIYSKNKIGIKASKKEYLSFEDSEFEMPKSKSYTVRILNSANADAYSLETVLFKLNGKRYHLLGEEYTVNKVNKDTSFELECRLYNKDTKIKKYQLIQPGNSDVKIIAESSDGLFSSLKYQQLETTSYKVNKTDEKKKRRPIYIRLIDENEGIHDTKINLDVINVSEKEVPGITFGKDWKFQIPNEVPFVGGNTCEFALLNLPVNITINEDNEWEATLGFTLTDNAKENEKLKNERKSLLTINDDFKKSQMIVSKSGNDDFKKSQMIVSKSGKLKDNKPIASNPEVKLKVIGYGCGDLPSGEKGFSFATIRVLIEVSVSCTTETGFNVQGVPMVFAFDIKGKVSAGHEFEFDKIEGVKTNSDQWPILVTVEGNLFLGAGFQYVVSVGPYGGVEVNIDTEISKYSGINTISVTFDCGAAVRMAGKQDIKIPLAEKDEPYYIYKRDSDLTPRLKSAAFTDNHVNLTSDKSEDSMTKSVMSAAKEYAEGDNETLPRKTSTTESWSGSKSTLRTDIYGDASPKLVQADGKTIMLFLDDIGDSRASEDKSTLMYSVLNNGKWETPKPVWDDGTADFGGFAASCGTDGAGYVVWNNCRSKNNAGMSPESVLKNTEVAIAGFDADTNSFVNAENITDNNLYEIAPMVAVKNGEPIVEYTTNADSLFRFGGDTNLYFAEKNSSWDNRKIATIRNNVICDSFGTVNGQAVYAYSTNPDNNLFDMNSSEGYIIMDDGVQKQIQGKPVCVKINGYNLYWTDASNRLFETDIADNNTTDTNRYINGTLQQVVSSENNTAVIYTRVNKDTAKAYAIYKNGNKWSQETVLTDNTDYLENISATYIDENFVYAYNHKTINSEKNDFSGKNTLEWSGVKTLSSNLVIDDSYFNTFEVESGKNLNIDVSVSNKGTRNADSCKISILDGKNICCSKVYNETIEAGSSKEFTVSLPVTDNIIKKELTIVVEDPSAGKVMDAGKKNIVVGEAIISVAANQYNFGGDPKLTLVVSNEGFDSFTGDIELIDMDTEELIETYHCKNIAPGESISFDADLEKIDWDSSEVVTLFTKASGADGEYVPGNNYRTIAVEKEGYQPIRGITINKKELELSKEITSERLTATVLPENADNKNIKWQSSDPDVASVDKNGFVTAVSAGTAKVTAETEDGEFRCSCIVKVDLPNNKIALEKDIIKLKQNEIQVLDIIGNGNKNEYEWSSEDPAIASIDENGVLIAKKEGKTTIRIKSGEQSDDCMVSVKGINENITLVTDISKLESDHPYANNEDHTWYYIPNEDCEHMILRFDHETYLSDDYLYVNDLKYKRNDLKGKNIIVQGNLIKIRLTSDYSGYDYGFKIDSLTPLAIGKKDYTYGSISLTVNTERNLADDFIQNAESFFNDKIIWSSADERIARVSDTGNVTAVSEGETVITAYIGPYAFNYDVSVNEDEDYDEDDDEDEYEDESRQFVILYDDDTRIVNGKIIGRFEVVDPDYYEDMYEEATDEEEREYYRNLIGEYYYLEEDEDYYIDFYSYGDVTYVAVYGAYESQYFDCEQEIWLDNVIQVRKIKISGNYTVMAAGTNTTLTAAVSPGNASSKAVSWSSSNTKYATVSANGSKAKVYLKAVGAGKTVTIKAKAKDGSGIYGSYKISIKKHKVKSIKLKAAKSVKAGKSIKVKAVIKTTGSSVNKKLKWSVSNSKYAKVSSSGVVKTTKAGKRKTVTITAQSTDGTNKKASKKIKIK